MESLYGIPPYLSTREVDDDTHKNNVPEQTKPGENSRNPSSGALENTLCMVNAAICHFLLLTLDCSDIQPLLAFFFWPAHVLILIVLIVEVFCLSALWRRSSTNPPKHAHGQVRSKVQRDRDPVLLLGILCAYWIKLLQRLKSAASGSTQSAANGFPIDNPQCCPADDDNDEERDSHYTSVEIELMLYARRLANQAGHNIVKLAKSVEEMAARDPRLERKPLGPGPQSEDEYGITGNPIYAAMHLAMKPLPETDLLRQIMASSPGGSMVPQDPGDCSLEDLEDFDICAPTSFEVEAPPIDGTKCCAPGPNKSTWDYHYPWERAHKEVNHGRPLDIPATERVSMAEQQPKFDPTDPNLMPTYGTYGFTPFSPGVRSGKPIGDKAGSPKRTVDEQMELLVERVKQGSLPKIGASYDVSNQFKSATPKKQPGFEKKQSSPEKKQPSPEKKSNHETRSTIENRPARDKTMAPEKASTPEGKTSSENSPTPERKPTF